MNYLNSFFEKINLYDEYESDRCDMEEEDKEYNKISFNILDKFEEKLGIVDDFFNFTDVENLDNLDDLDDFNSIKDSLKKYEISNQELNEYLIQKNDNINNDNNKVYEDNSNKEVYEDNNNKEVYEDNSNKEVDEDNIDEEQLCQICYDNFLMPKLSSACGRDECNSLVCKECLNEWYDQTKRGCVIVKDNILCPFCKSIPIVEKIDIINEKILVKIINFNFNERYYYALCTECNNIMEYCERECSNGIPNVVDFICHKCIGNFKAKRCPGCNMYVEKVSGCNHISCFCGTHWCYVCRKKFDTKDETYRHLSKIHGGYFNDDQRNEFNRNDLIGENLTLEEVNERIERESNRGTYNYGLARGYNNYYAEHNCNQLGGYGYYNTHRPTSNGIRSFTYTTSNGTFHHRQPAKFDNYTRRYSRYY